MRDLSNRKVRIILNSEAEVRVAVLNLIFMSIAFQVVPLPDDKWEIAVKQGDESRLRLSVPVKYYGSEVTV